MMDRSNALSGVDVVRQQEPYSVNTLAIVMSPVTLLTVIAGVAVVPVVKVPFLMGVV